MIRMTSERAARNVNRNARNVCLARWRSGKGIAFVTPCIVLFAPVSFERFFEIRSFDTRPLICGFGRLERQNPSVGFVRPCLQKENAGNTCSVPGVCQIVSLVRLEREIQTGA